MTIDDRLLVALNHFARANAQLNEALALPEGEIVRDAVIQRFEFTFEAGWKAAYRWLRARGVDTDEDAYSVIPEAFKRRLISDEAGWGQMRKCRKLTSHTYNQTLAVEVYAFVQTTAAALLSELLAQLQARAGE